LCSCAVPCEVLRSESPVCVCADLKGVVTAARLQNAQQLLRRSRWGLAGLVTGFAVMCNLPMLMLLDTSNTTAAVDFQDRVLAVHYCTAAVLIGSTGVFTLLVLLALVRLLDNAGDLATLSKQQQADRVDRANKLRVMVRFVLSQIVLNSTPALLFGVFPYLRHKAGYMVPVNLNACIACAIVFARWNSVPRSVAPQQQQTYSLQGQMTVTTQR
jgi:hypothetical protein